jgi:hypothetical protein
MACKLFIKIVEIFLQNLWRSHMKYFVPFFAFALLVSFGLANASSGSTWGVTGVMETAGTLGSPDLVYYDPCPGGGPVANIDGMGQLVSVNPCEEDSSSGPTPVPEPSIIALFALGLVGIGFARRRRQA